MANASIRYGASIRKRADKIRHEKIARYSCDMCGKDSVKRLGTGIWKCRHCGTMYAGGSYSMTTPAGRTAKRLIQNIQK